MEDRVVTIDDFPMPGDFVYPQFHYPERSGSPMAEVAVLEQLLRYPSPLPAEYHEIITQEAKNRGLHGGTEFEDKDLPVICQPLRLGNLEKRTIQTNEQRFQHVNTVNHGTSEEQISYTDFLRESYPPSLLDASHSSSSDESVLSGTSSLELSTSRDYRASNSTVTPHKQRWRRSVHRQPHDGRDIQPKPIDSSRLYRKLRENFRGASLRSQNSRASSDSSGSQEALHSLQKCSEKNSTLLNLQELRISDPQYSRSTLEFCEDKISTWPCGSALQTSLLDELSLKPQGPEEKVSCHHFEYASQTGGGYGIDEMRHGSSRFSWSTIYTLCEIEKEEAEDGLSWHKKWFKRPKTRPRIPEWLTGHD